MLYARVPDHNRNWKITWHRKETNCTDLKPAKLLNLHVIVVTAKGPINEQMRPNSLQ